jgi:hypothetical protein
VAPSSTQPYFHTTLYANLPDIAEQGLVPRSGAGLFQHGGYAEHSQGRVFASDTEAALVWFGKVGDQAEHYFGDDSEPDRLVPVLLRLDLRGFEIHRDEVGSRDVFGESVYVERPVPSTRIEYWSPVYDDWMPVGDFDPTNPEDDVYRGVSAVEHYDEDGDTVDEDAGWESRGFSMYGPYDDGGFKPNHGEDPVVWTMGWERKERGDVEEWCPTCQGGEDVEP